MRALAFLLLSLCLLKGLGALFDFAARRDVREKARWILAQHDGDYDFAVLGTSRPYLGVDISLLQDRLGGRGINLSLDGAGYAEQLLALREFLRTNRVHRLLLDINLSVFDRTALTYPFHEYEYLPYEDGDPLVRAALEKEYGMQAWLWRWVPFWRNGQFNSKIGFIQLYTYAKARFDPRAQIPEFDAHGSCIVSAAFHQRSELHPTRWNIEPPLVNALLDLVHFARSQGITVVLTMAPEWERWSELQLNRAEALAVCQKIAAQEGLNFLTSDDLPFLNDTAFFVDPNHLNAQGAHLYTLELARRLKALPPRENPAVAPAR